MDVHISMNKFKKGRWEEKREEEGRRGRKAERGRTKKEGRRKWRRKNGREESYFTSLLQE